MGLFPSEDEYNGQKFGIGRSIAVIVITAALCSLMLWAVNKPFVMGLMAQILDLLITVASVAVGACVAAGFPYKRIVSAPFWTRIVVAILLMMTVGVSLITLTRSHQFVRVLNQLDQHREDENDDE